jgi:hypothetical protein
MTDSAPPPADEPTATPEPDATPDATPPPAASSQAAPPLGGPPSQAAPPPGGPSSQAAPPPPMAPQYAPPYPAAIPPARPGMVTWAGITMIALGGLIVLFGLFALIAAAFVGGAANSLDVQAPGFGNFAGALAGVIIVFALILLGIGILDIVAGANVLGGRSWARITGIVVAVILGLFGLASLGNGSNNGGVVGVLILAANVFIVFALATTGPWFASRTR